MVARSKDGQVTSYPVTETVHKSSICYVTQTPAQIPQELQDQARQIAEKAVGCLEGGSLVLRVDTMQKAMQILRKIFY